MRRFLSFALLGASISTLAKQGALNGPEIAARKAHAAAQEKLRKEAAALEASALPNLRATWRNVLGMVRQEIADMGGKAPGISRQVERATLRSIAKATASMSRRAGRREAQVDQKRRRAGVV